MYKIGMLDSGIGGLNVLEEVRKIMPGEKIIYYNDSGNNPYGSKSKEEIISIVDNIVQVLLSYGVKEVILACNTASTMAAPYLKEKYPDTIFISTVPAVKVATDNGNKKILVLSTPVTAKSDRLKKLVSDNKHDDQEIYIEPCDGLANAIERDDKDLTYKLVKEHLSKYFNESIDAIVLGCTHYCFIRDIILEFMPDAKLFDGNLGVALEAKRQLDSKGLLDLDMENDGEVLYLNTGAEKCNK